MRQEPSEKLFPSPTEGASRKRPFGVLGRVSLAQWMLIALAAGIVCGFLAPEFSKSIKLASDLFLRLIRAIIAPILFGVLVRAIGGAGAMRDLGRIGWKSIVIYEAFTTIALLLGWFAGLLFRPGADMAIPIAAVPVAQSHSAAALITSAVPTSVFDAMARGDVLQIVVFCFLFGFAALRAGKKAEPVIAFASSVAEISFEFTNIIMLTAPVAVFAAMASTIANSGMDVFYALARFFAVAWGAELLFLVGILGAGLAFFGVPIRRFLYFLREPFLIAFATTSSAAALPKALENLEKFGISNRIIGFVAPLSLSLNMNGSTIYLSLATLFVAQAAGISLSFETQLMILLTLKLTSKGVAGIPRANFVILTALFESYGLPLEGLAMLLGIDALVDTIRTSVNIASHCAAPAMVAGWEGERLASDG